MVDDLSQPLDLVVMGPGVRRDDENLGLTPDDRKSINAIT
jgi:hypothetical protein